MKKIFTLCVLHIVLSSPITYSSEVDSDTETNIGALSVDRPFPFEKMAPFYKNDELKPLSSTFTVEKQVFLSNDLGERKAVVTIKSSTTSLRRLSRKQIIAVFANGDKQFPSIGDERILIGESVTLVLDFGTHQYPIMYLYTKN